MDNNIRSFYEYCVGAGYIVKNYCKQVKWVKERKVVINTITDNEKKEMLSYYKGSGYLTIRNKCIVAMLLDTGIRNFELCTLKFSDLGEITIKILGKGNKEGNIHRFDLHKSVDVFILFNNNSNNLLIIIYNDNIYIRLLHETILL